MSGLVIFFNERSCHCEQSYDIEAKRKLALRFIQSIRAVKSVRSDLAVFSPCLFSKIVLGDNQQTLSVLLGGEQYKEEWRFIKNLDNRAPWDSYIESNRQNSLLAAFKDEPAIGIGLAWRKKSAVLSLVTLDDFSGSQIAFELYDSNLVLEDKLIRNFSEVTHIQEHMDFLRDFGHDISSSSLIYQANNYVIRMFLDDHEPAHCHILENPRAGTSLAKIDINTLDTLSMTGRINTTALKEIKSFLLENKDKMLDNWQRCRTGRYPISLQ